MKQFRVLQLQEIFTLIGQEVGLLYGQEKYKAVGVLIEATETYIKIENTRCVHQISLVDIISPIFAMVE